MAVQLVGEVSHPKYIPVRDARHVLGYLACPTSIFSTLTQSMLAQACLPKLGITPSAPSGNILLVTPSPVPQYRERVMC